jgi:hypothetical protein
MKENNSKSTQAKEPIMQAIPIPSEIEAEIIRLGSQSSNCTRFYSHIRYANPPTEGSWPISLHWGFQLCIVRSEREGVRETVYSRPEVYGTMDEADQALVDDSTLKNLDRLVVDHH